MFDRKYRFYQRVTERRAIGPDVSFLPEQRKASIWLSDDIDDRIALRGVLGGLADDQRRQVERAALSPLFVQNIIENGLDAREDRWPSRQVSRNGVDLDLEVRACRRKVDDGDVIQKKGDRQACERNIHRGY